TGRGASDPEREVPDTSLPGQSGPGASIWSAGRWAELALGAESRCQTSRDGGAAGPGAPAGRFIGEVRSAQPAWRSCDAGPVRSGAGELIAAQPVAFF